MEVKGEVELRLKGSRRQFLARSFSGIAAVAGCPRVFSTITQAPAANVMAPDPLLLKTATEMARLIRSKSVTSKELVSAHLARIRTVNSSLNAVCQVDEAGALKAAEAADEKVARGEKTGPLHGVPVTIKDSFDTRGIVSTGGTTGRTKHIPTKDAGAVARLRAAGAIILGKTNTPELTLSYETENLIYGRTNNPYDFARTCGGSSGGAAAILAAGGTALELGSDTAGSIRIPAHFCGIAGLKPTYGRVSRAGHIIPPGGVVGRMTHIGPMARSVEDLALALSVIGGADPEDPDVVPVIPVDHTQVDTRKLHVAYYTRFGTETVAPSLSKTLKEVVTALAGEKIRLTEAHPEGFEAAAGISSSLNSGDGGDYYRQLLRRYGTTHLHPDTATFLQMVRNGVVSGRKYSDVLLDWSALRESALKFLMQFDLLICPPCSGPAPKHGESGSMDFAHAYVFNLLGWPAAVVRAGRTSEGLPVGVQIVGRPWREDQVLALALKVEEALGGYRADFQAAPTKPS